MTKSDLANLSEVERMTLKNELPNMIAQAPPILAKALRNIMQMLSCINDVNIKSGDKVKFRLDGTTGVVNKINGELLDVTDEYNVQRAWGINDVDLVEDNKCFKDLAKDVDSIARRFAKDSRCVIDAFVKDNEPKKDEYDIERWTNQDDDADDDTEDILDRLYTAEWVDYTRNVAKEVLLKIINRYNDYDQAVSYAVNIAMMLRNELKSRLNHG